MRSIASFPYNIANKSAHGMIINYMVYLSASRNSLRQRPNCFTTQPKVCVSKGVNQSTGQVIR